MTRIPIYSSSSAKRTRVLSLLLILSLSALGVLRAVADPMEISLILRPVTSEPSVVSFGSDVIISGDLAIIGDSLWDPQDEGQAGAGYPSGAVHIYDISNRLSPARVAVFFAPDVTEDALFGFSLALDGDTLIVGAPNQDGTGAAYIYDISTPAAPAPVSKVVPDDPAAGTFFGYSVDIEGNVAVVGSPGTSGAASIAGAAYIFDVATLAMPDQDAKIGAATPTPGDLFGFSVAISGDLFLIGAPIAPILAGTGFAELHDISDPTLPVLQSTLTAVTDNNAENMFGESVDIAGDVAVIGASGRDGSFVDNETGAIYVFDVTDPINPDGAQVIASDAVSSGHYGADVEISGDYVVVGGGSESSPIGIRGYLVDISNPDSPFEVDVLDQANFLISGFVSVSASGNYALLAPATDGSIFPAVSLFQLFESEIDLEQNGDISGVPAEILPGNSFTADSSVRNVGGDPSGDFRIDFFLSTDATISTSDTLVGSVSPISVAGASSTDYMVDIDISAATDIGYYYFGWIIDSAEAVIETDEDDNVQVLADRIIVGTAVAVQLQTAIDKIEKRIPKVKRRINKIKRSSKKRKVKKRLRQRLTKKVKTLQRRLSLKKLRLSMELS